MYMKHFNDRKSKSYHHTLIYEQLKYNVNRLKYGNYYDVVKANYLTTKYNMYPMRIYDCLHHWILFWCITSGMRQTSLR